MSSTSAPVPSEHPAAVWAQRVAWTALLACAALLPVTTSLTFGTIGGTWSYTEDFVQVPKLLLLVILLCIATLAWVVDIAVSRRAMRLSPAVWALGAFAALASVSTALAPEPVMSFFGSSELMTGALTWLASVWVAVLLGQYVTSGTRMEQAGWAFLGGGVGVSVIGLLQAAGADPLRLPVGDPQIWMIMRASSTLGNPDYAGAYLVAPAIVGLSLAFAQPIQWKRWLAGAGASVCALASFVTLTRAAWIGIAVGVILYLYLNKSEKLPGGRLAMFASVAALALVAVGALLAGPEWVVARFSSVGGGLDSFSSGRITLWGDALRIIGNHPLLGTGADRLALGGYEVQRSLVIQGQTRFVMQDPHNLALLAAGVFGVPALLTLLTSWALALRAAWAWLATHPEPSRARAMYSGWVCALAAALVTAFFSVTTLPFLFGLMTATGMVLAPTLKPLERHRWVGMASAGVAIVVLTAGLYGTSLAFASSRHLMQARYADTRFHLEEAIRLSPWDTRLISNYYFAKINANRAAFTGDDVALAHSTAAQIDSEIRAEILKTPGELLFYRLRIYLYEISTGFPGYQAERHREAIEAALSAFPDDPEFTEKLEALSVGAAQ